ncbi:MAG: TIGR04283 family arsenosugar biosynthesis glycosyltransferase [Desulfobacterales bacterium]|nr:TIGR04283 family arsenosugar biosynthesis glycosyltransferase [Desulfobacterales bacterium]
MPPAPAHRHIILFGRYPVPGVTKTRLIPILGALGAADLQRQLTEQAVAGLAGNRGAPLSFAFTGGTPDQVGRWLGRFKIRLVPQPEGDLGQRMRSMLDRALDQGAGQAVLVGTDVPGLTARHVHMAFEALVGHDLVLGPSTDGGYYLVGCRRPADLFDGIPWGTTEVLAKSLAAAHKQGLSTALLPELHDIDTETDLKQWQPRGEWRRPYLSVVIPALNEAHRIAETVSRIAAIGIDIIVADGGSRDGTPTLARRAGAAVVETPRGRAIQLNRGAGAATGRVLLFLHADTLLPGDFGVQLFELLMDPEVALGAFRFATDWAHPAMRWIERAANWRSSFLRMPYGDQAFFMRREMFDRAGGFPPVPIAEDLFLARRMARLGRIGLAPGAAVTSARRWRSRGILRTTLINYLIAGGCLLGVDPGRLAPLYKKGSPFG